MPKQSAEHSFANEKPEVGQFPALPVARTASDPEAGGSMEPSSRKPAGGWRPNSGRRPGSKNKSTLLQDYCNAIAKVANEGDRLQYLREIKERDPRSFAQLEMQTYKAQEELALKQEAQDKAVAIPQIRFVRPDGTVFEDAQVIEIDESGNPDAEL